MLIECVLLVGSDWFRLSCLRRSLHEGRSECGLLWLLVSVHPGRQETCREGARVNEWASKLLYFVCIQYTDTTWIPRARLRSRVRSPRRPVGCLFSHLLSLYIHFLDLPIYSARTKSTHRDTGLTGHGSSQLTAMLEKTPPHVIRGSTSTC